MKKLKELKIFKKQLAIIKNKDVQIHNLIIMDVAGFNDDFYLENIEVFIDKKNSNICQNIIRSFDREKLQPYLERLINVIVDSDNYNVMIDLLHYNRYKVKDNDKRPLKDFKQQELIMVKKILDSDDPIVYLRAAMYYYGMRWKFIDYIPFQERHKTEDTILSYDFKKYNLKYELNRGFDETKEPHTYFELLLMYCRDYFNGYRWPEAEQRVFKFAPYYMKKYIQQVAKWQDPKIEDILLEMNQPELYFIYAKNNLKKGWEDFRNDKNSKDSYSSIKDEIIDAALDSIASSAYYAMAYTRQITKKRLSPRMEEKMLIELNKKIDYYYGDYFHFEDVSQFYLYMREIKERFPLFEQFLLKLNDLKEGLKLDILEYEETVDPDDFSSEFQFKKLLDEIIFNYTVTNRGGTWKEIGINDKKDLIKLRTKIATHGSNDIKLQGYGELDY